MANELLGARLEIDENIKEIFPKLYAFGMRNSENSNGEKFYFGQYFRKIAIYMQEGYGFTDSKGDFEVGFQYYGIDEDGEEYEMDALAQSFSFYVSPNTYHGEDWNTEELIEHEKNPHSVKFSECATLYSLLSLSDLEVDKYVGGLIEGLIDRVFDLGGSIW